MKEKPVSIDARHLDSANDIQTFAEKTRRLNSNHILGYFAACVNAVILTVVQWHQVGHRVLYAWLAMVLLITSVRGFLSRRFHRREIRAADLRFEGNLLLTGILASGIVWGLAGILLFPRQSCAHQLFTAFTIGGMVAGASAVYAALRRAFLAFSLPAMLPIILNSIYLRDDIHLAMAMMMVLFLILVTITNFRNYRVLDESIKLRFERQGLLDYLAEAKDRAELMNSRLKTEFDERLQIEAELERHKRHLETEVQERTAELQDRNRALQFEMKERGRAQAALQESEERYRLLVENTNVGIVLISDQRIILFANKPVARISGYSVEEIVGKSFIDFVHPEDRQMAITNHTKRVNGENFTESYPIRMLNRNDGVFWLEINAVHMSYEGRPAIIVFMRDITKQRQMEAQLYQSEKMASIGQLAAGVAHEINNPVGFVNSNLHTLYEYQKDAKEIIIRCRKVLADIKTHLADAVQDPIVCQISAIENFQADVDIDYILEDGPQLVAESQEGMERIRKIVLDLKNFAHPGSQKRQMININESIESTLNIVWNELKYNASVVKDFDELPEIRGYPQQLNQVFMNLLVNAGQAMEQKGEIKIQTRALNEHVEIKFTDTGCGIPQENLNRIFDPFFTTKPVGKGTGLGLNVSYNIIAKHNGTILVESAQGKGTTFTIQLPA
jgi:PAS domain S-box-containing protein